MCNTTAVWQRAVRRNRNAGANSKGVGGAHKSLKLIETADIRCWADRNALPQRLQDLVDGRMYSIPMPYGMYNDVEAVVVVGKLQVWWLLQLVFVKNWVLHIDGKFKLHHGGWVLVTIGTHVVEQRRNSDNKNANHSAGVVHAFRPLAHMLSKRIEDTSSIQFMLTALEVVVRMCA